MSDAQDQSLVAAHPRRSAWVSANAGSGKTHTLANRVSRLLLDGARPERILCLTYTKAAAAEMQDRLFKQLGRWSMLDDETLFQEIRAVGGEELDKLELRKARRLFAQALETPGGLKIQTIHSFCQHLLARFPLEAGIPPSFDVLDEQTARELIAEARNRVLERAGTGDGGELAKAVAYLVTHTSESRLHDILSNALGKDRAALEKFLEGLAEDGQTLSAALRLAHEADPVDGYPEIAEKFCREVHGEADQLRQTIAWLASGKGKADAERAADLQRFLERPPGPTAYDSLREAFLTSEKGELYSSLATKALQTVRPDLFAYLQDLAQRLRDTDERCRAAHAAALAESALTIAQAVLGQYAIEKRARAMLDYDDLIAETLSLLDRKEAAAWVLYKLDGGLDHVLIDEAQDTSPVQWKIVRKLSEEFFAGEGDGRLRTIFAVGDEKQSIFSFQGADPAEFAVNRHYFEDHARRAERAFADVRLSKSRRSAPEILAFVDEVFSDETARNGLTSEDESVGHEAFRTAAKGRVEFWPAIKDNTPPKPESWLVPIDLETPESPVVQLAEKIASEIKTWIDGRTKLPGHDAPIRAGDIMILMPRREPFASEIIRHLKNRNIPVAGADRLKILNQIAVMDLMALGRFALLPEDDLNLAALLRSPLIDVREDDLFKLAHARNGTLWSALLQRENEPPFDSAAAFLRDVLARADFSPPYEFYARFLGRDGLRTRLLARLGAEADDAIHEFLALALEYEALSTPSLQGFLHWIEKGDAEIKRDMDRGRNEVRVMTVHGAKGLEADIVILPDTTTLPDGPGRRGELLYTDAGVIYPLAKKRASEAVKRAKAEAEARVHREHRRLLYVALTRAKDRLIVCGFENQRAQRDGTWYRHAERAATAKGTPYMEGEEQRIAVGSANFEPVEPRKFPDAVGTVLPNWVRQPATNEREAPRIIRPSEAIGLEEPAAPTPSIQNTERFRRGVLVHALLAHLPELAAEKREAAGLRYLAARGVSGDEAAALLRETLAVIVHEDFAPAFGPTARAEAAIVAELPELGEHARVTGRLDRLAVSDTEVLVIDFKTNRPPPERAEDVSSLYLAQMALYRAALQKTFPQRRIACALVWTQGPTLMRLPDALLDSEILKIQRRLQAS